MSTIARTLPDGFSDLEAYVADWARATRKERYDVRLSKTIEESIFRRRGLRGGGVLARDGFG